MKGNNFQWENDRLVFNLAKTKGDQSGDKSVDTWNEYSNPKNPEICPILALEKYLCSHPDLLNGNFTLFLETTNTTAS